jgi:hypothetical protein
MGRSLAGRQSFPAQERAGAASLYSQVAPITRGGPRQIPGTVAHGEPVLSGIPHRLRRIRIPRQPVPDSQTGMAAALDEFVPHRHPDVLVQELGGGIQHPNKKME